MGLPEPACVRGSGHVGNEREGGAMEVAKKGLEEEAPHLVL